VEDNPPPMVLGREEQELTSPLKLPRMPTLTRHAKRLVFANVLGQTKGGG
jgi:hypothetical protein